MTSRLGRLVKSTSPQGDLETGAVPNKVQFYHRIREPHDLSFDISVSQCSVSRGQSRREKTKQMHLLYRSASIKDVQLLICDGFDNISLLYLFTIICWSPRCDCFDDKLSLSVLNHF